MKNKFIRKLFASIIIISELFNYTSVLALTKEESIYVNLNSDGKENKITVSEHLYDLPNEINDITSLSDIKSINSDDKYNLDGNKLTWKTSNKDIYYQGTTDKELPISLSIKYYLDNKEMNVNDMLSKKGHIKIVMEYENHLSKKMNINGKYENIYTPFAVVTTSILNNTDNHNIKVTNGKVVDNGVTSFIVAVTSPGLYESLKIDELKDINKVEISYDTDNFSLNSIYSLATSNMFDNNNLSKFSKINELYNNINLLQSNMNMIVSSSKKLSDGSKKINNGINELNNRVVELTNKYNYYRNQDKNTLKEELIKIIEENINKISSGLEDEIVNEATKLIKDNSSELEHSLIEYTKKNTKLVVDNKINDVVKKVDFKVIVNDIINSNLYNLLKNDQELKLVENNIKDKIILKVKESINNTMLKVNSEMNNLLSYNDEYINEIATEYNVDYETAKNIINRVQNDNKNKVNNYLSKLDVSDKVISILSNEEELNNIINTYINNINSKLQELINNNQDLIAYEKVLKEKIVDAIKKDISDNNTYLNLDIKSSINNMIDEIINKTASDIASKYTYDYSKVIVRNVIEKQFDSENVDNKLREVLKIYENDISDKLMILDNTINTLSSSIKLLNDGSNKVTNGMDELSKGLDKYNREGINKISKLVNGDVKKFQSRFEAVMKLSKDYKTFDSINKNDTGTSKIVFMIDSISKIKEEKIEIKEEKNESFIDKIKGLFN